LDALKECAGTKCLEAESRKRTGATRTILIGWLAIVETVLPELPVEYSGWLMIREREISNESTTEA
jgi:hypothetical protein